MDGDVLSVLGLTLEKALTLLNPQVREWLSVSCSVMFDSRRPHGL